MLVEIRRWVAIALGISLIATGIAIGATGGGWIVEREYRLALEECKAEKSALADQIKLSVVASAKLAGRAAEIAYQWGVASVQPAIEYRDRIQTITTRIPVIAKEAAAHVPPDTTLPGAVRVLYDTAVDTANNPTAAATGATDGPGGLGSADPVETAAFVETAIENAGIAGQNGAKVKALQTKLRLAIDAIGRYNCALEGGKDACAAEAQP